MIFEFVAVVAVNLRGLVLGVAGRAGDTFTVVMAGVRIGLAVLQIFDFFSNGCIALMAG